MRLALAVALLGLPAQRVVRAQTATAATFGDVIRLASGTPSDVVLDESRHYLYLINNTASQVNVLDYTSNQIVANITVGATPLAGAMSMDNRYLYVTSSGTSTLNQIDLGSFRVIQSVVLPSAPQGVEVGSDGRVLVSMNGTGVVSGVPQGTLSIFDPTQTGSAQLQPVSVPALPSNPAAIPATPLPRPITTFASKLLRTPDGNYIVGVITPTSSTTYLFVYEVASGIVLRNRTVSGASSVLSMAPDGSKFMSGMSLFDITTLQVIAVENNANAPFAFSSALNTQQNVGGSIFTPDGTTLYAAFNTAPVSTPPVAPQASTLLVNDPTNLGIRLGINLPESIVAKIVMTADGSQAWGLSNSGLLHLPLGKLYTYPILVPETNTVFLSMDDCNRGLAQATVNINNAGAGELTYTVSTANNNAALVYQQSSGLAPSTITFTMEPGRTGITRQAGTNIWSGGTGVTAVAGTPFTVTLASAQAINVPSVIRVYMNYRQPDQRGVIFPLPTTPNINTGGADATLAATTGNEGLQDLLLDEARGLLYITNSGLNRIEVFNTVAQQFLNPIPVGQFPHQMAMSSDGNTLYVGNAGGESISMVDLNLQEVVGSVVFPPIPRNGTAAVIYPRTLAMGLFGLQFEMSSGTSWEVVENTAIPRSASTIIPTTLTGTAPNFGMIATPADDFIVTLSADGHVYLYNATEDAYVTSQFLNTTSTAAIQGYYGPLGAGPGGAYYLVDGVILSPSLDVEGGSFVPSTAGAITTTRNVAAVAPLNSSSFLRLTTPIRTTITATTSDDPRTTLELVNIVNGTDNLIGVVPEQPFDTVLGTARFNTTARTMVVDSAGTTAYALTISGLSVISLAQTSSATQPAIAAIVNSNGPSSSIQPGSFITINGQNLASTAKALTVPPPTVLGGSCVTFGDIAAPLLVTSSGQIQAQVPTTVLPGTQIVEVRSLATAQDSAPVELTIGAAGGTAKPPASVASGPDGARKPPTAGK
jgi:DNA-binding beta-propeller fold protein YncE